MYYKTITLSILLLSFFPLSAQVEVITKVKLPSTSDTNTTAVHDFSLENLPAQSFYTDIWSNENTRTSYLFQKEKTYVIPLETNNTGNFVFPCSGKVCSPYGIRNGRLHSGMDIKQRLGDSIVSVWDGVVRMARMGYYGYGGTVIIRHDNGLETMYAHLSRISVLPNQKVKAGQLIGKAGRTGRATTEHLHFETRFLYEHFNPRKIIDFDTKQLICDTLIVKNGKFYKSGDLRKEEEEIKLKATINDTLITVQDSTQIKTTEPTPQTKPQQNTYKPKYHIVKQGDTLSRIAKKHHTSIKKLCEVNRIKDTSILSLGQKIKLP